MSTNYIDQITDTAGTTHDISEGDSTRIFRATCTTAAGTTAKVATLDTSNRNFSLAAGVRVAVTFTYGNSATTPTLRVDGSSTGTAKTIASATAVATRTTGNGTTYNTWGPYETVIFTYDGTYWVQSGSSLSIYNAYALANSKTANTGTITEVKTTAGTHSTIDVTSGKAEFNVPTKTSHLTNDSNFVTSSGVTSIATSSPISGGTITTTGTISHATSGVGNGISTAGFYKFKYDTYGHVTGVSAVTASDITGLVTIPDVSGKIDTAGTGLSKSGTTLNHSNSVTAQTTQAVYPIKIDKNGHISEYGSAVTITDENVKQTALNGTNKIRYLIGSSGASQTSGVSVANNIYMNDAGPSLTIGLSSETQRVAILKVGINFTYSDGNKTGSLRSATITADRTWTLPDKTGTIALTSDIPTIPDISGKLDVIKNTPNVGTHGINYDTNPVYSSADDGLIIYSYNVEDKSYAQFDQYLIAFRQFPDSSSDNNPNIFQMSDEGIYIHSTDANEFKNLELSFSTGGSSNTSQIILDSGGTHIYNVVTPTNNTDAANKKYVDDNKGSQVQLVRW